MSLAKRQLWLLLVALVLVPTLAFSASVWLFYTTAYQRHLHDLKQAAVTVANILEAVTLDETGIPGTGTDHSTPTAVADRVRDSLRASQLPLADRELLIAYRDGDAISVVRKTPQGEEALHRGETADPVTDLVFRALHQGESGSGEIPGHGGAPVLAGYAPAPRLGMAFVLQVPLARVQAPYRRAAMFGAVMLTTMLVLLMIAFLFYRRHYVEQIAERERTLASIIQHIPAMLFLKRADDLSFVLFNKAGEELTGLSGQELAGKTDYDFFPREQADFFTSRDRRVLAHAGFEDIPEEEIETRTKGTRILHTRKVALTDADGNPEYLLGISEDITERKNSERLAAGSNQLINAILDTTPVMIALLDTGMRFLRVNYAYAEADGKTPEYFVGKKHFDLYPDDENEAIFRNVIQTGVPYTAKARPFEYGHDPERGVTHWDWTLSPLKDTEGQVTGLVLSLLNVTEHINALEALERSEKKLRELNRTLDSDLLKRSAELETQTRRNELILSTTPEGYFAADVDGRIRKANAAFCRLIGYTHEELIEMHISQIEAIENAADVAAHIEKITATGHDVFDTRHRRKDGTIIDVEISVNLVEVAGKKMFYAFVHDLSQRKQHEKELIAARDAAQRASQAKSEFLSRMSHELRTPMNAILGFSQVMQMEALTTNQQEFIKEIQEAGDHLLNLINELLDLSRIESGNLALAIQSVQARTCVKEAVSIAQPLIENKGITLVNKCREEIGILADPTRLRQILVNLLSNAVKYNRPGGSVTIDCVKTAGDMLRLSVTDTGKGISPEDLDKLFQPFERLDAVNSDIEGTGIGLALSKQLTQLMAGRIGADSVSGEGSTFWLELPAAPAPLPGREADSVGQKAEAAHDDEVVLYIEDNAANLKVVEAIFDRRPGLHLISAINGRQGLELAQQYMPDAILLDIHLPDIDGFAVLRELKSEAVTRNIPVIALSADAMPMDIERGLKAGFDDYLTKPINIDLLVGALKAVTGEIT